MTQPNRFLQFLASRGMTPPASSPPPPIVPPSNPIVPRVPFTPNTGFAPLPANPFVPNVNFGQVGPIAPPAPVQTVGVPNSRYGTATEFVPRFQIPVNLNVPVWQPPPGYIPPNPTPGAIVPIGGFPARQDMNPASPQVGNPYPSTIRPDATPVTETTAPVPATATPGASAAAPLATAPITTSPGAPATATPTGPPPLVTDPVQTYPIGGALPQGTVEAGWTTDGIRLVTTPDGAVRQVDASGTLAGPGITPPTESLTLLPNGVVQAPGGAGPATPAPTPPTLTEQVAQNLDADGQARIAPYLAEMTARGETPEQYLSFLTTRAQAENVGTGQTISDLEALQDQRRVGFTTAQPTQAQQDEYRATQAQIDTLRQGTASGSVTNTESSANWGYANQATDLFAQAGLAGDGGGGIVGTVTGTAGAVAGAVGEVVTWPQQQLYTGIGSLMAQAPANPDVATNGLLQFAVSGPAMPGGGDNGSLLGFAFDPREAADWAIAHPELVNAANANGYDSDGDGKADYTGGRAVWEMYASTRNLAQRAVTDVILDPVNVVGGAGTLGRHIAGEGPGLASDVTRAVRGVVRGGDEATSVAGRLADPLAGSVDNAVGTAPRITGNAASTVTTGSAPGAVGVARRVVGGALQVPDLLVNQTTDRVVGGALGLAGRAIRATPGLGHAVEYSPRVRAEIGRDDALGAVDRMTALEQRQAARDAARLDQAAPIGTTPATAGPETSGLLARAAERDAQTAATSQLDVAFRETVSQPWRETAGRRRQLFQGGIIRRRIDGNPTPGDIEAGRTFVDLAEATWRQATEAGDTATLTDRSFGRWMRDAEQINARVGRRGDRSQQLDLAWRRAPDAGTVPTGSNPDVVANRTTNAAGEHVDTVADPLATPSAGIGATQGSVPVTPLPRSSPAATAPAGASSLDWRALPIGERDRGTLSETLRATASHPEQTLADRFLSHVDDAMDEGLDETQAIDDARARIGDDIMRSRGIDPTRRSAKGLGWLNRATSVLAQSILYKPTSFMRRVLGDVGSDVAAVGITGNADALPMAFDRDLIGEAWNAQRGPAAAGEVFGNSEASRIVGDAGLGTYWRGELSQASLSTDRATGQLRRGRPTGPQARTLTDPEPGLDRALNTAGRVWQQIPRDAINGLSSTRRMALYAQRVSTGLPEVWRAARDNAITEATRHGLSVEDAMTIAQRTLDGLVDDMEATGARGFDAVRFRDRLAQEGRDHFGGYGPGRPMTVGQDRALTGWTDAAARGYQDGLSQLDADALKTVNDVLFSYRPTRADEALSNVMLFHYYGTRAAGLYVTEGLKNPVLMANYFRATEGLDRAADEGDYPAPVRGFVKVLNSDTGWAMYMNPTAMIASYVTFRDAAGNDDQGRNHLEQLLANSPGMINPLIATGLDWIGATPNGYASDPLVSFTERRLFGNALNFARARGYLPGGDGGLLDAPYEDVLAGIRDRVSGVTSTFAPGFLDHVQATDSSATGTRQLNDLILADARTQYGDTDQAYEAAAAAMHDPDNPLYRGAYLTLTRAQLITSTTAALTPTQAKLRTDNADEASGYVNSQRQNNPTLTNGQLAESDPAYARAQLGRDLITTASPIDATLTLDAARSSNIGTPEQRRASQQWTALSYGDPTEVAAILPSGAQAGDMTYSPAQIAALPRETRMNLADQYTLAQPDGGAALGDYRTARDSFEAGSPEWTQYRAWQGGVRDEATAATGGDVVAWAERVSETNPTYGTWWRGERDRITSTVTDPATQRSMLENTALSTDGYLSYSGRKSDLYAANPQPLTGPMGMPGTASGTGGTGTGPTVDLRTRLDQEQATYAADVALADAQLREMTGRDDISFAQLITDQEGGPAVTAALEARGYAVPRMGSNLYVYARWVQEQAPGAAIDFAAFVQASNSGQTTDARSGDILQSRYTAL